MLRSSLVVTTFVLCLQALPTVAQDFNEIEGLYTGQGEGELTVDLTHIENDRYAVSINTVVPMEDDMPGCGGSIDGEVLLDKKGGNFFVENEFYDASGDTPSSQAQYCEIGLAFDGAGGLVIDEREGCISYHGAACGFTGDLSHDAAGL